MARARNLDDLEMGFISPSGEWIPVPFCEHEKKAIDLLETYQYEGHFLDYATDVLIEKFGYILIDGCHDVDVQIPKIVTDAQKVTLERWLYNNRKFIKWLSTESINNLRRCIDWLDKGIKEGE